MSMSDYLEKNIEKAANSYFDGENVGGLNVSGISFTVEDLGDYHIWLSGSYTEDFMYMLRNSEYYGEVINKIADKLNAIAYDAQDYDNETLKKNFIKDKVDELWKTVEDSYDEIYEGVVEGLYEQLSYAGSDLQNEVNNEMIESQVGGVDVDEFKIGEYFEEVNGSRASITVYEEASIDLTNFSRDTLEEFIESY